MGQTGSGIARKLWSPFKGQKSTSTNLEPDLSNSAVTPFVFKRTGSMYINEEGDLAHEFYEEVRTATGTLMRRTPSENLMPQGDVPLQLPRINMDFPVVMWEVRKR